VQAYGNEFIQRALTIKLEELRKAVEEKKRKEQ
jgi:hypothetical protein